MRAGKKSGYQHSYILSEHDRLHYRLPVSEETHNVIKHYAKKWDITMEETTQIMLAKYIKEALDE